MLKQKSRLTWNGKRYNFNPNIERMILHCTLPKDSYHILLP